MTACIVIFFLLLLPLIVRLVVDKTVFKVVSLDISEVTDRGFVLSLQQDLGSLPLSPTIDTFQAQVNTDDRRQLFALDVPKLSGTTVSIYKQPIYLDDPAVFAEFTRQILLQDSVDFRLQALIHVNVRINWLANNDRFSVGRYRFLLINGMCLRNID